jgi:hypothetical protein
MTLLLVAEKIILAGSDGSQKETGGVTPLPLGEVGA